MQHQETVESRYRVPAHEVIWSTLGPGALLKMAAALRQSRTGWIIPVGGGVTHHIVPVSSRHMNGKPRWTVEHWVVSEGNETLSLSHMDDFEAHDTISQAVEHAVEKVEWLALNPLARVMCPWCFESMDRNALAQGHDCPI